MPKGSEWLVRTLLCGYRLDVQVSLMPLPRLELAARVGRWHRRCRREDARSSGTVAGKGGWLRPAPGLPPPH